MKIIKTKITTDELTEAQGGYDPDVGITATVWVECPDGYTAEDITAEDIINDSQISVVAGTGANGERP